jgi:hypothetical protein
MPKASVRREPVAPGDLLTVGEVLALLESLNLRLAERAFFKWVRRGLMPPPIRFTRKTARWHRRDILAAVQRVMDGEGSDHDHAA